MPRFAVRRDGATAEFFDGTACGEFLLVKDTQTGEVLAPQFESTVDQNATCASRRAASIPYFTVIEAAGPERGSRDRSG
jgi:hypothetical protein